MSVLMLAAQAMELQKLSFSLIAMIRDFQMAWPDHILRPTQFAKAIVTAVPYMFGTVAIARDLGALYSELCSPDHNLDSVLSCTSTV